MAKEDLKFTPSGSNIFDAVYTEGEVNALKAVAAKEEMERCIGIAIEMMEFYRKPEDAQARAVCQIILQKIYQKRW